MKNEKRLIDAKAGKKMFSAIAQPAEYKGVIHMVVPISEIDKLPTVDAVPVVRCRDCKYWENGKDYEPYCNHWGNMMTDTNPDDFCSYGERKDGDGNG